VLALSLSPMVRSVLLMTLGRWARPRASRSLGLVPSPTWTPDHPNNG